MLLMAGASDQELVAAIGARDARRLANALTVRHSPLPARAVVEAGRLVWIQGLELLVEHGADLDASYRNYRALHALIQEDPHEGGSSTPERVACLAWLLQHGADPEQLGAWPSARALVIAAFVGEPAYVEALEIGGAARDVFTEAACGRPAPVAARLRSDPGSARGRDVGGLTALQCCAGSRLGRRDPATAARLVEIARLLLEAGADPNASTRSWGDDVDVAYFAIGSGQIEILELLLGHGADSTAALPSAAWHCDETSLDLLLRSGAEIDRAVDGGRPVLNQLVRWGQFVPARLLLARGADPNTPDKEGWTAVHQAASRGNLRMLEDLLAAGGDGHRRDRAGRTPADVARAKGRSKLVAMLEPERDDACRTPGNDGPRR